MMILILLTTFVVISIFLLMRSYGLVSMKEEEAKADPELPLIKQYYEILEHCHTIGTISEEEYHFEKGYLEGRLALLEKKAEGK